MQTVIHNKNLYDMEVANEVLQEHGNLGSTSNGGKKGSERQVVRNTLLADGS